MRRLSLFVLSFLFCSLVSAADFVWIEGEQPTSVPKVKQSEGWESLQGNGKGYVFSGWGNVSILSEEKMLHTSMNPGQVDKYMPEDGMPFGYEFEISSAGKYHIWVRVGWEFVRSDFQWRLDSGEWNLNTPLQNITTNVQPLQTWNEMAWCDLGEYDLSKGKHSFTLKHYKYTKKDKKGNEKTQRILFGLDAICIYKGEFVPDGKWKPGQDHRTDKDKEAEANIFRIAEGKGPGRIETQLDGLWTTATWDEYPMVDEDNRVGPVKELPDLSTLRWYSYSAPGNRNSQYPEMVFSHRYLVRARIDVPASLKGRGFFIDVQRSNFLASVFVNGRFAGFSDTFLTAWQMDLTNFIEPGKVNDLVILFKDAYYALNPKNQNPKNNRRFWNIPIVFLTDNQGTCAQFDYPLAGDTRTGLLEPLTFVVGGAVYTEDVFVKTSVKKKEITLEVTVLNPSSKPVKLNISNSIVPWNKGGGGDAECTFPAASVNLGPGERKTVELTQGWADPHLWWPDDPFLYRAVTDIEQNGRILDQKKTRFGFREWDWSTHMFVLNGIKWPMWGDISHNGRNPKEQTEVYKTKSHQNHMRLWARGGLGGMTRRESLNYFDEHGIMVRSSGTFDGQRANYGGGLVEEDTSKPKDKRGRYPRRYKKNFFENWNDHLRDWIKEERNHASIYIYSLENEVTYINVNNLGMWREVEPAMTIASHVAKETDPTRPSMVDGGNCLRDESLEVNGAHYTEFMNGDFRDLPDLPYSREQYYDKNRPQRGAWRMVPDRPIMMGEVYFANGYTTDRFASVGGDRCFIGRGETKHARGLLAKIFSEGYRWAEVSAWQFWMGGEAEHFYWNSWSPVALLCRQWNWTFGENTEISRTLGVFNDTHYKAPIEASWSFSVDGKEIDSGKKTFNTAPGEHEAWDITFRTPSVSDRKKGEFVLTCSVNGKTVFRDVKPLAVIAPSKIKKPGLAKDDLGVYDPKGTIKAYLGKRGIPFTELTEYGKVPDTVSVVIVGPDSIPEDKATDTTWYAEAAKGKRVVVLDQKNPLYFQAIPADLKPTSYTGRIGFSEDLSHPVFAGLDQPDFFCWGNDHIMYRNVYKKGTKGGRSLLHCDTSLSCTAMVESQIEDGLLILSQMAIGDKIGSVGVAQQVFNNLLNYAASYKPVRKNSFCAVAPSGLKAQMLEKLNLKMKNVSSPLDALMGDQIAIVDATPGNLKILAENRDKVEAFCKKGGWLMLWGLTPEGLSDYNTLVGYNHVIRPFEKERVVIRYPLDPLGSGLTLKDVVMDTGEKMYGWMALKKPDTDGFSYIIDHTDIAPFCKFPTPLEMGKPSNDNPGIDHWPRNMVNGFTSDDNWAFAYTIIIFRGDKLKFTLTLPKEEELIALKIRPSKIYNPITKFKIYFDDDPEPVLADIPVRDNPITEDIPVKGRKAKKITLEVAEWTTRGNKEIVVIDNLWLQVKRSDEYMENVKCLLNIGALMRYSIGKGGIFLNQVNLVKNEKNPENAGKKSNIVKTVLSNMGAVFAGGGKTVVAGSGLRYEPVKIPESMFNVYATGTGQPKWFMEGKRGDMKSLPVGEQTYANIDFYLSDFNTSPVPSVMMLGCRSNKVKEQEIKGIPVGKKADALFFLHTFHPEGDTDRYERSLSNWIRRPRGAEPGKPWVFKYVVNYSDGTKAEVPVVYNENVGRWLTDRFLGWEPRNLPGAALAWVGDPPENPRAKDAKMAVYAMQWNNPNPDKTITNIDVVNRENGKYGAPAVFAISTAEVIK